MVVHRPPYRSLDTGDFINQREFTSCTVVLHTHNLMITGK